MENTLLGVLIGGVLTGIPTVISTVLNNRQSRRKAFDETAFSIAVKAWESHCKMAEQAAANGHKATVGDIQGYVLYSVLVMDAASKGRMDTKNARQSLEDIHEVMKIVDEFADKRVSGEIKTPNNGLVIDPANAVV
jgi:hypothetical protein